MAAPNLDDKTKSFLELVADILTVLVVADIVWVMFFNQEPPIDGFHDIIAFLGTLAAGWWVWKVVRKNKAFG